jgi:hypothetical protein
MKEGLAFTEALERRYPGREIVVTGVTETIQLPKLDDIGERRGTRSQTRWSATASTRAPSRPRRCTGKTPT